MFAATRYKWILATICSSLLLSAAALSRAQSGPEFEVPLKAMELVRGLSLMAGALSFVGWGLIMQHGAHDVATKARRFLVLLASWSVVLPLAIYAIEPEQWPVRYPTLSQFARWALPIVAITCIASWRYAERLLKLPAESTELR